MYLQNDKSEILLLQRNENRMEIKKKAKKRKSRRMKDEERTGETAAKAEPSQYKYPSDDNLIKKRYT